MYPCGQQLQLTCAKLSTATARHLAPADCLRGPEETEESTAKQQQKATEVGGRQLLGGRLGWARLKTRGLGFSYRAAVY
jgi:hypothetical protein